MVVNATVGDRVRLTYAASRPVGGRSRPIGHLPPRRVPCGLRRVAQLGGVPLHEQTGEVVIAAVGNGMRKPGPRNHGVLVGGALVVVPCGNLDRL